MVSVDISLTPSLPGATLSLSLSLNKRILGDFTGYYVFSEEFASDRRKASRGSVNQNVAGLVMLVSRVLATVTTLGPPSCHGHATYTMYGHLRAQRALL